MTEQPIPERSITADFDAFEAAHPTTPAVVEYTRIRGHVVPIPTDMPARTLFRDIGSFSNPDPQAVSALVVGFYGQQMFDAWLDGKGAPDGKPVGLHSLVVIVSWSTMRAQGDKTVTFDQVAQQVANARENEQARAVQNGALSAAAGAPSDAERRHAEAVAEAGKALSSASGAPSRLTSDGSTGYGTRSLPTWEPGSSASFWQG